MIVFDLKCGGGHVFEAWFASSDDYESQRARTLVACPICDSNSVDKAAMAPAVAAKGNRAGPAEVKTALTEMARLQARVEADYDYVGDRFAEEARAIHDGEAEARGIYGETTPSEADALRDDGIAIAPLPFRRQRATDA